MMHGLPGIFLMKTFQLDGKTIANPLYSYTVSTAIFDNLSPILDSDYSKPKGYTTVRYPFAGLVGPADIKATEAHNAQMNSLPEATINKYLSENVQNWLGFDIQPHDGKFVYTGTRKKFAKCLEAPNYTVFSNTTSTMQWNEDQFNVETWPEPLSPNPAPEAVISLESPQNDILVNREL
jgi:tyrosinase